nr:hypothetical protein [Tanacetum cinerariifolium]
MFTRSIVIKRRVEDLQLGVESYQKKLNLTKPNTYRTDLRHVCVAHPHAFLDDLYLVDHLVPSAAKPVPSSQWNQAYRFYREHFLFSLGRHLEEIHVTWAQFWKKPDKMAISHEDGLKNQDQSVETASRLLVSPSEFESDDVMIFVMASGHSDHKETLEE